MISTKIIDFVDKDAVYYGTGSFEGRRDDFGVKVSVRELRVDNKFFLIIRSKI